MSVMPTFVLLWSVSMLGQVQMDSPVAEGFISAERSSTEQELAPYTIITVDTVEDLENYLSGGYPTPEIQAILDDESIPQEDRYWLDCRMRSTIAQMLHRFYDQEGNIIELDAAWIAPGEDYWQEVMMVHPPVADEEQPSTESTGGITVVPRPSIRPEMRSDGPTVSINVKSGDLYNLYGEEVGQLAAILEEINTSRDGSIAAIRTGSGRQPGWFYGGSLFFSLMYSDGTFEEINVLESYPEAFSRGNTRTMISQDGSISTWNIFTITEPRESYLLVYDRQGNEIESYSLPSSFDLTCNGISISSDNSYIACAGGMHQGSGIIDRRTGEIQWFNRASGRQPVFSENSRYCALGGCMHSESSYIVDLENDNYSRISIARSAASPAGDIGNVSISNDGQITVVSGGVYFNGENVLSLPDYRWSSLSPNGYFCISSTHTNARGVGVSQILLTYHSLLGEVER